MLLIHICILSLAIHPTTKVTGVLAILNKKVHKKGDQPVPSKNTTSFIPSQPAEEHKQVHAQFQVSLWFPQS